VPVLINLALIFAVLFYAVVILVDLFLSSRRLSCLLEAAILTGVVLFLHFQTGFPAPKQAFGGGQYVAVGVMFAGVLLGTAGRYYFYKRGRFRWRSFLRPFAVSPIILLPMPGTVSGVTGVDAVQLISFFALSFQNGFFWKEIFDKVSEKMKDHGAQGDSQQ
jgi:hypothetical protein